MSDHIVYEVAEGIGQLTINRPEKRNAMTFAMLGEFIETVHRAGADPEARVLIIAGVPGAFCAGTDLADLASVPGGERGLRGTAEERGRWWPIVECPKPVIAAIDGPAVGMGAEFTSQCDIRLATPNARFAWNFAHRGLVPDTGAGSWLLPRLIGPAKAMRLLYTGEFLGAEEALEMGYVERVVPPEELADAARGLAEVIAKASPFSHARIKALVYEGLGSEVGPHMQRHTQALAECFKSADHAEGVAAFLERREPRFAGE
ncbi:MAG: enoyl-CoA hydratase/isomerase family protein [Pseudomonadales bacterium]|nr:enoyl-CoA hydratase/isomerase family protein [Pseudomonadales bacterium]NIX07209.1 enoyl-CoA hydratase/isomerase family protein [Pseudomonadales bacterium]